MRALIVAAEGTTDEEWIYPFYRLQEAGLEVFSATLTDSIVRGASGCKIQPHGPIAEMMRLDCMTRKPGLLVLPGGVKAIEKLRQHKPLIDHIASHHARGGFIASICHGAQLLISAGLCSGRTISGYYSIKDDIMNAGGMYLEGPVSCERIVSVAHYKDMAPWMAMVLREVGA